MNAILVIATLLIYTVHGGSSSNKKKQKIVFIGDSVLDTPGKWLESSFKKTYNLINHARGGWTTDDVLGNTKKDFKPLEQDFKEQVVILSIGGNDILAKKSSFPAALANEILISQESIQIASKTKQILEKILEQTSKVILSVQYKPGFQNEENVFIDTAGDVTNWAAEKFIKRVRKELREFVDEKGIVVADLMTTMPETKGKYVTASDPIHLNEEGAKIQSTLYKKIIEEHNWESSKVYYLENEELHDNGRM